MFCESDLKVSIVGGLEDSKARLPGASQIDILVAPCHVPQSILADWTGSMYLTSSPHNLLELFMVLSQDLLLDYDLLQRLSVLLPSSFSTFFLLVPLLIDSVCLPLSLSLFEPSTPNSLMPPSL